MNALKLDFTKNYGDIISSFKEVFGIEYTDIINERLNNVLLTTYYTHNDIYNYYLFLEEVKSRELCIEFLKTIGIDLNINNYYNKFEGKTKELVDLYLDGEYAFIYPFNHMPDSFRVFALEMENDKIKENKLKFIRSITNDENITIDSKEYNKLLPLMNKYNEIYSKLCEKMSEYLDSIKIYKEYYYSELRRLNEIKERKVIEFFDEINELYDLSLEKEDINSKLLIEYFYEDNIDKKNEFIDKYNFIPKEILDKIKRSKEKKKEEIEKEFIMESDTFKSSIKYFYPCNESREYLYLMIKRRQVCIHAGIVDDKLIPLMFLTLRTSEFGETDYIILHELIHALESEISSEYDYRCGFEPRVYVGEKSSHIYKTNKRKYERFNETVADIFALEVLNNLRSKNIYLLDDKHILKENHNQNTSQILKHILSPFIERYRNEIIYARITGDFSNLFNTMGKDNFENLNDIIDYIDMLIEMGLETFLMNKEYSNKLVMEYINELKKLSNLYDDMSKYRENKRKML